MPTNETEKSLSCVKTMNFEALTYIFNQINQFRQKLQKILTDRKQVFYFAPYQFHIFLTFKFYYNYFFFSFLTLIKIY